MRDVLSENAGGKVVRATAGMEQMESCSTNDPSADDNTIVDENITDQGVVADLIESTPPVTVATPVSTKNITDITVQSVESTTSNCKKCSLTLSKCRYQRKTNTRLRKRVADLRKQVKELKAVIANVSLCYSCALETTKKQYASQCQVCQQHILYMLLLVSLKSICSS
jgi:ribosomal protein L37AE/L43A